MDATAMPGVGRLATPVDSQGAAFSVPSSLSPQHRNAPARPPCCAGMSSSITKDPPGSKHINAGQRIGQLPYGRPGRVFDHR
jgi:hypothetical protein